MWYLFHHMVLAIESCIDGRGAIPFNEEYDICSECVIAQDLVDDINEFHMTVSLKMVSHVLATLKGVAEVAAAGAEAEVKGNVVGSAAAWGWPGLHLAWPFVAAALVAALALLVGARWWYWPGQGAPAEASGQRSPGVYTYRLVKTYSHDPKAFTQGLLWENGSLYESTGLNGRSTVRELRLEGNKSRVVRKVDLEQSHFGEGLVHRRGTLVQLLWRQGEAPGRERGRARAATSRGSPARSRAPCWTAGA
ncbi:unnamed protein product [Prorocentrum cordatum]|uniref:Uncharacterized protein n=1 Tax=Prorocentrum cordatum TaxID=2364126 RepID=A0ABN9T076_9DINO|nr:unnamed protein product [Polarella glacialis]